MFEKKKIYLGIDLNNDYCMLTYYLKDMKKPVTFSMVEGIKKYRIPMKIFKKNKGEQWFIGDEGKKAASLATGSWVENLFQLGLENESVTLQNFNYSGREIFCIYIKEILNSLKKTLKFDEICDMVFTIPVVTRESVMFLKDVSNFLGVGENDYTVVDYGASFYYYLYNQDEKVHIRDGVLYLYEHNFITFYELKKVQNGDTKIVQSTVQELGSLTGEGDLAFCNLLKDTLDRKLVSSAFLVGDEFDGEWMDESLKYICRGRKVFQGKNLFSKGACYSAMVRKKILPWNYYYVGEYETKINLSLMVTNQGEVQRHDLILAGENWYMAKGEVEVLLNADKKVTFYWNMPMLKKNKTKTLSLVDLPDREDHMTRLSIETFMEDDCKACITIRDLGFGEFVKSTHKVWQYYIE